MSNRTKPTTKICGPCVTFFTNACALVLAFIIAVEAAYIQHADLGYVLASDVIFCFFPAAAMFVIKSKPLSFVFLLAHLFISIRLLVVVRDISTGSFKFTNGITRSLFLSCLRWRLLSA